VSAEREQRTVFGEVAQLYEEARPSYPDEVFDTIIEYGALQSGDRVLEIGAGTGKATDKWLARGFDVLALEPSPGMADVLRPKGVKVEVTTFEAWNGETQPFRLVTAAQAWHWVGGDNRYERAAHALEPHATLALFWNKARNFEGDIRREVDAAYATHAPTLMEDLKPRSNLDRVLDEIEAVPLFGAPEKCVVTWKQPYTTDEYMRLHQTHSDHRILPDEQRTRLHAAVREVIDAYGGQVDITYDTQVYLARRR
jgi:SAM-dependent methyltransferase